MLRSYCFKSRVGRSLMPCILPTSTDLETSKLFPNPIPMPDAIWAASSLMDLATSKANSMVAAFDLKGNGLTMWMLRGVRVFER